ncbi:MAG: ribosome-associated translation inhibitor RaiA [Candidatus Fermentibacteraceae bacterium]
MNIEISARHFDLTDALRDHIDGKLSSLERYYDGLDDVQVILELSKGVCSTHVQMRGDQLRLDAKNRGHDMYASFDDCVSSLEGQLRRFKERRHNHPHRDTEDTAAPVSLYEPSAESELRGPITIENHVKLRSHSTYQAMVELEVSGDEMLVFYNEETGVISAAYRTGTGSTSVVELHKIG